MPHKSILPAIVVLCLLVAGIAAHASGLSHDVDSWRGAHEREIVSHLDALARLPSVAANPKGIDEAAGLLERELKSRGFRTARWTAASGSPPVVFGFYEVPNARRTVVFYAHYDGQPVTPSQWSSPPFEPFMREGLLSPAAKQIDWQHAKPPFNPEWRLFGRAVADDKASEIAFLSAFDALTALHRSPAVNLKVVWEGEEEAGSPHLAEILKAHAEKLRADLWLIGDAPVHQSRRPTLYFGARGSLDLEATIYGPVRALHDGHYGNWVPNPAAMAAELIAQMRDSDGNILIPGYSDDVRPLAQAEKDAVAKLPPVEDQLKREFAIDRSEGREGLTASTMRPAINIRGIRSGSVGADATNAIPVDAAVSMDFRLVPDQTPQRVRETVESFLKAKGWTVVADTPDAETRLSHARIIRLAWGHGYPALCTDIAIAPAQAAIRAADDAAGEPVALLPMMGGSVPIYLFHDILKVPVIGLPIVNHDDSQHAPNENLRLKNLWDGIDTYAAMMAELGW